MMPAIVVDRSACGETESFNFRFCPAIYISIFEMVLYVKYKHVNQITDHIKKIKLDKQLID